MHFTHNDLAELGAALMVAEACSEGRSQPASGQQGSRLTCFRGTAMALC